MASWPSISREPAGPGFETGLAADPTLRTPTDAGYVLTRARWTRTRQRFRVRYEMLTEVERQAMLEFQTTQGVGGASFSWIDPTDSVSRTVRLAAPLRWEPFGGVITQWNMEVALEEV